MSLAAALMGDRQPPSFDFLNEIKKQLVSERVCSVPKPDDFYRVSSLVHLCSREEVLKHIHNVESKEKIDHKLQRTFDIGSAVHYWIQNNWFKNWNVLWGDWDCRNCHEVYKNQLRPKECGRCFKDSFEYVEKEIIHNELRVTGHPDGIIDLGHSKWLLEIKTCSSKQFQLHVNIRKQAYGPHVDQSQAYMFLLKSLDPHEFSNLRGAVIFYFEKDESMIHDFYHPFDIKVATKVFEALHVAREGMREKKIPERTVCDKKSCARATRCSVKDICFSK